MGVFEIGSGATRKYWNCTKPENEEFSNTITGDVVEIAAVPRYIFGTQEIDRWKDGNPKVNMRITLLQANGEERCVSFKFNSGRDESKWCRLQQALFNAMRLAGLKGTSMQELQGLNITIATQQPPAGFQYGAQNPRPFNCQVNGRGTAPFRGCIDEVSTLRGDGRVQDGMIPKAVVDQPVNPMVQFAQNQAAQALGYQQPQQSPAEALYDQDIPF